MNDQLNVFVTESNVELFLSKVYKAQTPEERDTLLRLVVEQQDRMGRRREHVENGQRRLNDCRERVRRQRHVLSTLSEQDSVRTREQFLLDTLEKVLILMEEHQRILCERHWDERL